MKSRILALLLCLVLVASALLMTACGGKNKLTEVADAEERTEALGGFLRGIDAIRKGGVTATGSISGYVTDKKEDGSSVREEINLNLSLNYYNQTFDATASGTADGVAGTFEAFFDGSVFAVISVEGDDEPEYEVTFLSGLTENAPIPVPVALDQETAELVNQILALIDFDKVAANLNAAAGSAVSIQKNKSSYVVSVSSDALFAAAISTLNVIKGSGDKTVGELLDALLGAGTSEKLLAELGAIQGTDKLVTLIPKVEALLSDLGLNVDATYEFIAKQMDNATVEQLKAFIEGMLGEMTLDDGIEYVYNLIVQMISSMFDSMFDSMFGGENGTVTANDGQNPGEDDSEEESGAPTWAYIYGMIESFVSGKVNETFGMFFGTETDETTGEAIPFDIDAEVTPIIGYAEALKNAIQFNATVTCDKNLVPTKVSFTASVDTTGLPADMEVDPAKLTVTVNAEVKSSVTVAPSAGLQAKIDEETEKQTAAPAGEA